MQRINLSKNKPDYCRLWLLVLDVREDIWVTFEIDCSRFYYSAFPRNKLTGEYCSEITASGGIKINCMIPHSLTLICWTFDTGSYPSDHKMVISFAVQSCSCLNHVSGSEYQQWQEYNAGWTGKPTGYDRVRNTEIGNKDFELDVLEEAYTTEHWLVRIYKVKDLANRGNWHFTSLLPSLGDLRHCSLLKLLLVRYDTDVSRIKCPSLPCELASVSLLYCL